MKLAEARAVTEEIEALIRRINRTNAATELTAGVTITDAIAQRDVLRMRRNLVVAVADAASGRSADEGWGRQMRSELRELTDVPVPELRTEADDLARRYRELDLQIQAANWATDVVE